MQGTQGCEATQGSEETENGGVSNNSRVWLSTRGDSISLSHSMTGPGGP